MNGFPFAVGDWVVHRLAGTVWIVVDYEPGPIGRPLVRLARRWGGREPVELVMLPGALRPAAPQEIPR